MFVILNALMFKNYIITVLSFITMHIFYFKLYVNMQNGMIVILFLFSTAGGSIVVF